MDGEFNSTDFVDVFQGGKFELEEPAGWEEGDWNGDGRFGSGDFVAAFMDGGYDRGPRPAVIAVPEPTAMVILLTGIVAALAARRRLNGNRE
jgi:hypothetical protein